MGIESKDDAHYQLACADIRKCMVFDDIPIENRIKRFLVEKSDEEIEKLKTRIVECRKYLNNLAKTYN